MKKLGLSLSLLICSTLIAGCNFKGDKIMDGDGMINEVNEPTTEEDYTPVEERTKALKESPWDWTNNEDVYPIERLKLLDNGISGYPYQGLSSLNWSGFIDFKSSSEDGQISRYAIYDRENHKRLFDCFDGGGGGYIQVDESIDIDTVDIEKCVDKYNEVINILNSTQYYEIEPQQSEVLDEEGIIDIPLDGLVYRNDEYGFQVKFGKERGGGKIYESYIVYNKVNNSKFNDGGGVKNPMILFTVSSPWRPTFELIANIIVYTYDEYEQARQNQMDPECLMCSLEEFDNAIIGKNNKYYFLLGRSNRSDDELKTMFPSLECREETDSSVYGTYTYIYCDGIEYINGEPKKTGKNWIEQILPAESFSFFDV